MARFRMIDEIALHGMGRKIENALEGITLQIEKKAESAGSHSAYIYLIMDAQLNIKRTERSFPPNIRKILTMKEPQTALFVAPTGVGKAHLVLDLLDREDFIHFDFIIIIFTILRYNSTYKSRKWFWTDPQIIQT